MRSAAGASPRRGRRELTAGRCARHPQGVPRSGRRDDRGRRRHQLRYRVRRDLRSGGHVGEREVGRRPNHHEPDQAHRRGSALRGAIDHPSEPQGDVAGARQDADRVPESARVSQPAAHRARQPRAPADHLRLWRHAPEAQACGRTARPRGPESAARAVLPARVLGRPVPTSRHRPGACHQPQVHLSRRAGLRPRRLHPGAESSIFSRSCRRASA